MGVVINQILWTHLHSFDQSMKNTSFVQSREKMRGPMKQLFVDWERIVSEYRSEIVNTFKYIRKRKSRWIGGGSDDEVMSRKHVAPNIFNYYHNLTQIKWILTLGRIMFEQRQN